MKKKPKICYSGVKYMPKRKDEAPQAKTVKVRLSVDILERCNATRIASYHKVDAESKFLGYLVELGLNRYEQSILPVEKGKDESIAYASENPASKKEQAG